MLRNTFARLRLTPLFGVGFEQPHDVLDDDRLAVTRLQKGVARLKQPVAAAHDHVHRAGCQVAAAIEPRV